MDVYIVRHTSVDVPKGICYGQSDVPLKESFPQEAADEKERLEQIFSADFRPDSVYTSPLGRSALLAEFCGYPHAEKEPRIMEINFGEWEMQNFNDIRDPRLQVWYNDYLHVRATGGESFQDQFNRVAEFIQELKGQGKENVLLFCHGGVQICAKILSGAITPDNAFSSLDDYGSIIKLTFS